MAVGVWGNRHSLGKYFRTEECDVIAESLDGKQLLVGECKWSVAVDAKRLTAELLRKARLLPFAPGHELVPVLFLKEAPRDNLGNTLLPSDLLALSR